MNDWRTTIKSRPEKMSSDLQKIWYRFLDDGKTPYDSDIVYVRHEALVDDLRQAINNKNPRNVFSFQLKIFRSKLDYYNGEQHLESDQKVAGLGQSEDQSVYVLTPESSYHKAKSDTIILAADN